VETRRVVTAFLEHEGRVALFRRSQAVATYRGRWAGISGSIEPGRSPWEQVWTELEEETGLGRKEVWLALDGPPLEARDPELGRRWIVYPFLVAVRDADRLRLDWEHVEVVWVGPREIVSFPTVPRLGDTWDSLGPAREVLAAVRAIQSDREHGAAFLAAQALEVLGRAAESSRLEEAEFFLEEMGLLAEALAGLRPTMAGIGAVSRRWLAELVHQAGLGQSAAELREAAVELSRRIKAEMEEARAKAAAAAAQAVAGARRVVTASFSSTVAEALAAAGRSAAGGRGLEVRVAASGEHGERLVSLLREAGVSAAVFPVERLGEELGAADAVLVGADALLPDGSVVNGSPTLAVAQAARRAGVPFYAVGDSFKQVQEEIALEEGFDRVPESLITGIITERGLERAGGMKA
jgi:translation initiation factor 2B subunit (eIF-2B alpha/beta/delta family)/ADP-ribose pyrophosphatase YjhB (NUDIX family)